MGTSRAWRMILAHHSLDRHAQQQVTDEHDVCADCWQDTVAAVDAPGSLLISSGPLPEMDTSGVVTGPTVNWLLRVIDGCLRAEELDRRRPADPEVLRNVLAGMAVSLDENFPP